LAELFIRGGFESGDIGGVAADAVLVGEIIVPAGFVFIVIPFIIEVLPVPMSRAFMGTLVEPVFWPLLCGERLSKFISTDEPRLSHIVVAFDLFVF
jgi:hypothetical protein